MAKRKKYQFIIEKTNTGFSAYSVDFEAYSVAITSTTITEIKTNALDALNL